MALSEYYIVLYPLAFLLTALWRQPSALVLLLPFAYVFILIRNGALVAALFLLLLTAVAVGVRRLQTACDR